MANPGALSPIPCEAQKISIKFLVNFDDVLGFCMTTKISKRFKIIKVALIKEAAILHFIIYGKPSPCALIGSFLVRILQQSMYFCFGAKPANSTFATKAVKKKKCEN